MGKKESEKNVSAAAVSVCVNIATRSNQKNPRRSMHDNLLRHIE
jgi:hypothetical protein